MKLRVVAIPLFAAICLASPAIASAEQAQRRPRLSAARWRRRRHRPPTRSRRRQSPRRRPRSHRRHHQPPRRSRRSTRTSIAPASRRQRSRRRTVERMRRDSDRDDNERSRSRQPAATAAGHRTAQPLRDIVPRLYELGSYYTAPSLLRAGPLRLLGAALLPLESDRVCAVVADLRLDRVFELTATTGRRPSPFYYGYDGYGYYGPYGSGMYSPVAGRAATTSAASA